ncbi:hypothetical protein AZI87_08385 [Bdellovibrio bacteriovorus]|uniref:Transglycosylase SLT domain-containing protein n=1 Tax=Bdellovibrio bacteriovorus TaxID=959 RepID=A0A162GY93_BDEBC|nr:hypothetical protein [Bdellovibrio bacteriovorus]KYG69215.1 hypothetical protein AZI87_08385 [Bdellovibrio bacteriovorus]
MKNTIYNKITLLAGLIILQSSFALAMGQRLPSSGGGSTRPTTPTTPTTPTEPTTPPTSGSDVTPSWEAKNSAGKTWTAHVNNELDRLGEDMLDVIPADASTFCPNYKNLTYAQRKQYWTHFMSNMVRFESNYNTNTSYTEAFNDSQGRRVVSRGLLQISIESGNAYGCNFKSTKDLHDPLQNLSCGIRILNRWVGRDGRIAGKVSGSWRGGARYWAVLRAGDKTSYQTILSSSKKLSICK